MNAPARKFEAKPAVRVEVPLMIGIMSPSGSGKTLSALKLARGLAGGDDSKIAVIDTGGGGMMVQIAVLAALPFALAWRAFALSTLWGWFIVPFLSAPPMSTAVAAGALIIIQLSSWLDLDEKKLTWERFGKAFFVAVCGPLVALGIGYAIKSWFMP